MSDVVLQVENLYKEYRLGVLSHGTLYRDIQSWWARVRGKEDPNTKLDVSLSGKPNNSNERFWALQNISFEVKQGEVLGIIGRNGAGKSTLLKIISRVTAPTKGKIKIKGRVASLLEVGTGFHPELTGRENVYLNGTILGMTKKEITKKFDEIVAFAEIEKFIDTPVKRYSSGMYVRLAFAVAAHLEPEILIVDEVLAVGDAQFQKKCLGKMDEVGKEGRTVILVSHNMGAINNLCKRALWIDSGQIRDIGPVSKVVNDYLEYSFKGNHNVRFNEIVQSISADAVFKLQKVEIKQNNISKQSFICSQNIEIEIYYEVYKSCYRLFLCLELFDCEGNRIFESFHNANEPNPIVSVGSYVTKTNIPANFLISNTYELRLDVGIFGDRNLLSQPISFLFDVYNDGVNNMVYSMRTLRGLISPPIKWLTIKN